MILRLTRLGSVVSRIIRVDTNSFESFQGSHPARHTGRLKPQPSASRSYQTVIDDLDRLVRQFKALEIHAKCEQNSVTATITI
jgi:hypothetical protein